MSCLNLRRGASAAALWIVALSSVAEAQQSLPTLDVGLAKPVHAKSTAARARGGRSRTQIALPADPAAAAPGPASAGPPSGVAALRSAEGDRLHALNDLRRDEDQHENPRHARSRRGRPA
ncbi:hypothetical protein DSM21852_03190 [Methylocystis bryophila]|nr:hypothetical protein DSM21852_03190 [Methylocystis bryophila]